MLPITPPIRRGVFVVALAVLPLACSSPEEQKQRHFAQGNAYAAQRRDDFAVIEYANAVRIDPKFGEARLKLAETYERMKNPQAAFPEYIRAADALPANRDVQIKATELLILAGRFDDAKARATALLEKNPKDVNALILRANAMAALKDPAGAVSEIEEALKIEPRESRAFVSLGGIRMGSGNAKEAEAAFRQAITLQPSVNTHLALANFLWTQRRVQEAEQEIKQSITIEPRNLLANRMLASLYMSSNRQAEAEQPLKIIADESGTAETRFALADYYYVTGRRDEATKLLTALSSDQNSFARAEGMLASMEYEQGHTKEAHARIDKLLARVPKNAPALVLKARFYQTEKKLDEALEAAKAAVAADPQLLAAHYLLGSIHSVRRELPDAINAYTEVLKLNPRVLGAQLELSRLNQLSGNREAALRYAEEASQSAPTSAQARLALVQSLLGRGELDRAETVLKPLLTEAPNVATVHVLDGGVQAARNNDARARASFIRALELDPGNIPATTGLVGLDLKLKQLASAVNRVDAELAKQPDRAELLALAARVYDQAGRQDKAELVLRHAIATDPRFLDAYSMLAQLYIRQRRLDEARTEFEAMAKRDPRLVGPRTLVGMILQIQGKTAEAKRSYEATVNELPSAAVASNNLAYIYAEEGVNLDMALQLASNAKKGMPDSPQVNDTLGWVYYKKDLPALALPPLEESVKKAPDDPEVLYHLGMTYAKLQQKAKSREALERALKLDPKMASAAIARQTLSTVSQ